MEKIFATAVRVMIVGKSSYKVWYISNISEELFKGYHKIQENNTLSTMNLSGIGAFAGKPADETDVYRTRRLYTRVDGPWRVVYSSVDGIFRTDFFDINMF
jgi:hypothetical protein